VLNDCFYQPSTAACRTRAKELRRPLPMLNACLHCPNARRSAILLPRLATARDQAPQALALVTKCGDAAPPLQLVGLTQHVTSSTGWSTNSSMSEGRRPAVSSHIDEKIRAAYQRLAADTDEAVSVTRICAEAGLSRASYYRSPAAAEITQALNQPSPARPRVDQLAEEVRRLRRQERELRSAHAAELRELKETIAVYANQIQALALRNVELQEDADRLRQQLGCQPSVVRTLR
jgi:hypothetical protein